MIDILTPKIHIINIFFQNLNITLDIFDAANIISTKIDYMYSVNYHNHFTFHYSLHVFSLILGVNRSKITNWQSEQIYGQMIWFCVILNCVSFFFFFKFKTPPCEHDVNFLVQIKSKLNAQNLNNWTLEHNKVSLIHKSSLYVNFLSLFTFCWLVVPFITRLYIWSDTSSHGLKVLHNLWLEIQSEPQLVLVSYSVPC